jgi:hypothetical protein
MEATVQKREFFSRNLRKILTVTKDGDIFNVGEIMEQHSAFPAACLV